MQFIDLAAQQERVKDKIEQRIQAVLSHGKYIMGPEVKELEERLASYVGTQHAIGCASGTDALLLALMAYEVGPGDAVFTTPFTFIATAEVISLLGAIPVFVDIDPAAFNISPKQLEQAIMALKAEAHSTYPLPRQHAAVSPRGIIAVDLFGLPADYDAINSLAQKHGLFVIQDAAQSFGADYKGKKTCSNAEIGCTSFFPAKPLGCYGDGGMCFCNDGRLASTIDSLRLHGKGNHKYDNVRVGINGRLDTLQAAILLAKFAVFAEELELRQEVAKRYNALLQENGCPVTVPMLPKHSVSAWAQYSILAQSTEHRSELQRRLNQASIPTAIYYPTPLHLQTAYSYLHYRAGNFPASEDCANRVLSLPMHPYLKREDQERIAEVVSTVKSEK